MKCIYKNDDIKIYVEEKKHASRKVVPSKVIKRKSTQKRFVSAGRSR